MDGNTDLAAVGALVGDRVRAALLLRLLDGEATPASDLAAAAGASASLTSAHLRRLREGGLVSVRTSGRQRLYRLASSDVAEMLEGMLLVAPMLPVRSLRGASTKRRLQRARLCYDHVAGLLGTSVTEALVERGVLAAPGGTLGLDDRADDVLAEIGVDLAPVVAAPRPAVRQCTDWTERRPHLSGGLGAAVATRLLEARWVVRRPGFRGLEVTVDGAVALDDWLGLRVREIEGWRASA